MQKITVAWFRLFQRCSGDFPVGLSRRGGALVTVCVDFYIWFSFFGVIGTAVSYSE